MSTPRRKSLQPLGLAIFAISGVVFAFTGKTGGGIALVAQVGFLLGLVLLVKGAYDDDRAKAKAKELKKVEVKDDRG